MTQQATTRIRPCAGPKDLEDQYPLWLRATDGLPYAWRSSVPNARFVSRHAAAHPRSRWYAERNGELVGYIGTHPQIEWSPGLWLMPFGFPWTFPRDASLERALYERMVAEAPTLYPDLPRPSGYVQRFRGSWRHHLSFLEQRGWKQRWTLPLLAHQARPDEAARAAVPLGGRIEALAQLAACDPHDTDRRTVESLKRSFAGGWLDSECTWIVEDLGAFEIEVRRPWGEVRLLLTAPGSEKSDAFWLSLYAKAAELGASEVYFTVDEQAAGRREQLERRGFTVAETGVYPVLDVENKTA